MIKRLLYYGLIAAAGYLPSYAQNLSKPEPLIYRPPLVQSSQLEKISSSFSYRSLPLSRQGIPYGDNSKSGKRWYENLPKAFNDSSSETYSSKQKTLKPTYK